MLINQLLNEECIIEKEPCYSRTLEYKHNLVLKIVKSGGCWSHCVWPHTSICLVLETAFACDMCLSFYMPALRLLIIKMSRYTASSVFL